SKLTCPPSASSFADLITLDLAITTKFYSSTLLRTEAAIWKEHSVESSKRKKFYKNFLLQESCLAFVRKQFIQKNCPPPKFSPGARHSYRFTGLNIWCVDFVIHRPEKSHGEAA